MYVEESNPVPSLSCCVILDKLLNLSVSPSVKWNHNRINLTFEE